MSITKEQIPQIIGRVEPEAGKCVGLVSDYGSCAKIEERSIPYYFLGNDIEKELSYYQEWGGTGFYKRKYGESYSRVMLYSDKQKADMLETLVQYYDYNKSQYGGRRWTYNRRDSTDVWKNRRRNAARHAVQYDCAAKFRNDFINVEAYK